MWDKIRSIKTIDWILIAGLGCLAIGIGINMRAGNSGGEVKFTKAILTPTITAGPSTELRVVICELSGEVIHPGVYKLPKGSRWDEVFARAGGLAWEADREWVEKNVNKAKIVSDGEKIFVPKKNNQETRNNNQTIPNDQDTMTKQILGTNTSGKININTAGAEELDKLTGIGPAMAGRIIDYREKNDGFRDINEIKLVSGIGDKLFEKIKDMIEI